ncbi:polysaccharide pyruvyl transferase family protein [Streptomyces polygonati]|uniref:Polysaccharide pyruvyl transferase family protein n=1 Tax=Streptomyces polygonati TaxID=1617087 RepID=A0ABV8I2I1_9ACTN
MGIDRLLLIADAGGLGDGDRWHVGDEAMLAGTIGWLRTAAPGTELVVASSSPEWTRRIHGVDAVPCLDFGDDSDTAASIAHYRAVIGAFGPAAAMSDMSGAAPPPFVTALRAADAVLFCGAGNLCSAFPNRLYERITVAALARVLGRPYAFSAQTIGPLWGEADRDEVARALAGAVMVGTRDDASAALAAELGVAATPMADDALRLTAPPGAGARALIGVTLHRSPLAERPYDTGTVARALDRLAEAIGGEILFIPHFRGPGGRWSDAAAGDELAGRLSVPLRHAPWEDPVAVMRTTAACRVVLSTRYHPLVFALGSCVPALGLYQDEYHLIKMGGLMEKFDRRSWLHAADVPRGGAALGEALTALLDERATAGRPAENAPARSRILAADKAARAGLLARLAAS